MTYRVLSQNAQPANRANCPHHHFGESYWLCTCDQHEHQRAPSSSNGKARAKPKPPQNAIEREYDP